MKVRLATPAIGDGTLYSSLTQGAEYEVLGIEGDWFRLVNDRGEPVLFDPTGFEITDLTEPEDWIISEEEGLRYAYPEPWNRAGFFEDWHEGVQEVRDRFRSDLVRRTAFHSP